MSTMSGQSKSIYEFGPFRLDPRTRTLVQGTDPVSLTPKAVEMLVVLIENRDRVVSKDELMKTLWPDSFVEESNLSQNVFVLRKALGDSTPERRYILTVPGRGYQFTETVREVGALQELQPRTEEALVVERHSLSSVVVEEAVSTRRRWWAGVALLLLVMLAAGVTWRIARVPKALPQYRQRRLTANPLDLPVNNAAISPDGKYLGYSDEQGIHLQRVGTAESQRVAPPDGVQAGEAFWDFQSWYPDSTRFVALLGVPGKPVSLWSLPILGGTPLELVENVDSGLGVSPDGSSILFSRVPTQFGAKQIWLMGPRGESPHKILEAGNDTTFTGVTWSPSGNRIAYRRAHRPAGAADIRIESCDLNGVNPTAVLFDNLLHAFAWVAPDRLIYSRYIPGSTDYYSENLWELTVDATVGLPRDQPRRLTDWSGFWIDSFSSTTDGKRLTFLRGTSHESVFFGELSNDQSRLVNTRNLVRDDASDFPFAWTPDSSQVIFSALRTGTRQIYKQSIDGHTPAQLITSAPDINFYLARATPDGVSLVVEGEPSGSKQLNLYKVKMSGGVPQVLFGAGSFLEYRCTNLPANLCVYGLLVPERNDLMITSFDLDGGKGKELLRIPVEPGAEYHWALSPDGSEIGILKTEWEASSIRFYPLEHGKTRTIAVKGYVNLRSLDWAADSKSLFVGTAGPGGSRLLHVDLNGNAQPIWQEPQSWQTWGLASPDGRRVTMMGRSSDANVWMIDDF